MKKKKSIDVVQIVSNFQNSVLNSKPGTEVMRKEIRMMRLKIRPLQGDLMDLNLNNSQFLETLWSLGKLEEFFYANLSFIDKTNRKLFMKLIDEMHRKYEQELSQIRLGPTSQDMSGENIFEIEIYKEPLTRKKLN